MINVSVICFSFAARFFFSKVHLFFFFFFQWIETPWERFTLCEAPLTLSMALFVNRVLRLWGNAAILTAWLIVLTCFTTVSEFGTAVDFILLITHQSSFWQGQGYESVFYHRFRMNESKISHSHCNSPELALLKKKKNYYSLSCTCVYTVWMTIKLKTGLWNPPLGLNLC